MTSPASPGLGSASSLSRIPDASGAAPAHVSGVSLGHGPEVDAVRLQCAAPATAPAASAGVAGPRWHRAVVCFQTTAMHVFSSRALIIARRK